MTWNTRSGSCPDAVVLRETNGTAWFVDNQSRLRWIPDGGCFISLANGHLVVDHAGWTTQIHQFETDTYQGDAAHPGPGRQMSERG
jgi:hypothetical protein